MNARNILNGVKILDGTKIEWDRAWMIFNAMDFGSFDVQRAKQQAAA